jgi:predicted extracellular nuclease
MQEKVSAQSGPSGIMISEFRFSSPTFSSDEYIELFNGTPAAIDISGWWLKASDNRTTPTVADRVQIPANAVLGPGCYYLIASNNYTLSTTAAPDVRYSVVIPDDGSIALFKPDKITIVDQVGFRTAQAVNTPFFETERLLQTPLPTAGRIYERKPSVFNGFQDTDNNVNDFVQKGAPGPQNRSTSPCLQFTTYTPHDIQGAGAVSPLSGAVRVAGVVTARKSDGFFIQTESGFEDGNPDTSEGLFVSASPELSASADVGHLVKVIGGVEEFVPSRVNPGPSFTRISNVFSVEDLGVRLVPVPTLLTNALLSPAGSLAQLERLEGMRVVVPSLTAVSGTDVDGAFFAVLSSQARPVREPGVQAGDPVLPCALAPCNIPVFDGNPERLRVDSDGLELHSTVLVSANAVMTDVTGPLEFSARNYTLLPESLSPAGGLSVVTTPGASLLQFTVASLNLGSFDAARLVKVSQAVRSVLNAPDVIGVQGVDTFGALSDLAAQINSDAGVTLYDALPLGNADDGLGIGFLLKAGRASALGEPELISVRASMALRVHVHGAATLLPQDVTVVVNQFQSLTNIELNDAAGAAVRARRRAQAEAVANYVQNRQSANPSEFIVALGDFNGFDFNDGYVDVVGTVRGAPAAANEVVLASPSLVSPALVNADFLNAPLERYSTVSNGNAQSLDHVLVSASTLSQLRRLRHARVNADFSETRRDDPATPVRFSDRDPLVAYFTFPPDVTAPVFGAVRDVDVEATSLNDTIVTFETPTAQDNLDPAVNVGCDHESGTAFPVGSTAVTCFAQDAAGNVSNASFSVTVHDSTAPQLSMPGDQVAEATSNNGAVVNFVVTATDAVTANPAVDCLPLGSGSTFPLHNTLVTCSTRDDAGNTTSATFNVLVEDTTKPEVSVANQVAEATSSNGAAVTFSASATDAVSANLDVTCSPASGSTFALGTTTVNCSATDLAGNTGAAPFQVTVRDTTAPIISVPPIPVSEAASAAGAVVTFNASASDAVTWLPPVVCVPPSGSTFPVGNTLVTCSTEDAAHNPAAVLFTVKVQDTTPPLFLLPSNITEEATSSAGRIINYVASSADLVTALPALSCAPASGSNFPVGETTVSCTTSDDAGNTAHGSFTVTITPPAAAALVGRMAGAGRVLTGQKDTWFAFDVRRSSQGVEHGSMALMVRDGNGRPNRFVASSATAIVFSNSEGYEPGRFPRSGIDTVSFTGYGSWNGQSGYRFEVLASDRGEPGRNLDTFTVKVYAPNGAVVESSAATLRDGNIQSLR